MRKAEKNRVFKWTSVVEGENRPKIHGRRIDRVRSSKMRLAMNTGTSEIDSECQKMAVARL